MAKVKADTLLRKIQKGTSTGSHANSGGRSVPGFSFNAAGGISLFKKREIVEPYLHPIDSRIVNDNIRKTVVQNLRNLDPDIEKNVDKLLPTHLVNDLYSLYYNQSNKMKFASEDQTNKVKFGILDSINNSLIKIVTNNSHIGSYVYTEEIGKFLYKKFMAMPPEQRKKLEESMNNCNQGQGNGQQQKQQGAGGGKGKPDPNGNQPGQGQKPSPGKGDPNGENGEKPDEDQDDSGRVDSKGDEQRKSGVDNSNRGQANNAKGGGSETDYSQEAADQIDEDLKKMLDNLNSKQSQKELEQHLKQAEDKLEKLKEVGVDIENDEEVPEEEKREIIKNLNNLDSIRRSLQNLSTSKDKILKAVQKILSGTTNYFSQKCISKEVELFEADELLAINGIEFLHPYFKNSRIFDLSITERKYIGKFDLYVDCSGSMSSGCGGDLDRVARIDLAKSLAMQMKELGILGDLYEFEDRPKKIMNTDMSILMMAARGGTNLETVLQQVLKTGNNSVILTDGESHISSYTHKAFFIGVGTDFHYFKSYDGTGQKFVEEGQCVHYDGKNFVTAEPLAAGQKRNRY